jgi:uncharacterized Zn-binding protein involved in type VI secretion
MSDMPGIARVNEDSAGGTIIGVLAPRVFVNGKPIAVQGAAVAGHGDPPHAAPVMTGHSDTVFAHGIPICRQGDAAICDHPATDSDNVFAG